MVNKVSVRIGDSDLVLETGRIAKQANGAVFATYGGSAVLSTVCCGKKVDDLDYVPLQVEYNEKFYAAGKIPGGFLKREGRPKDKEILVSRLIDRPMRPLFYKEFSREIQVIPTVISADMINPPDIIAMVAASASVLISDIPFNGPVGAARVCLVGDEFIVNPTFAQISESSMDIVVAGTAQGITMVEGGGKEVSEEVLLSAIAKADEVIKGLCALQEELAAKVGVSKLPVEKSQAGLPGQEEISHFARPLLEEACFVKGKMKRHEAIAQVKAQTIEKFAQDFSEDQYKLLGALLENLEYRIVRSSILDRGVRTDGRGTEDIRPISCEVGVLPRTHGSALFTRGETQSLVITTLGTVFDEQMMDDIDGEKRYANFMLHYNFPPFSVGETGRLATGRREIGHGHLAQRAIAAVLPNKNSFPYTIRVVSEICESNGSSSMASVCGGTLSLLNAGVPMGKPVAGIAMGLISGEEGKVAVLSDILGEEDHLGDMDFKVAGTQDGITAFQMDIKIANVTPQIMSQALAQAKRGRLHILNIMNQTISEPQKNLSEFAPKIVTIKVDPEKIGGIIGPGGKTIKSITEATGANINIENDGSVTIYSREQAGANKAVEIIKSIVEEPEVGNTYTGKVRRIMDFGAFVEFLPGKEGLVHISKLSRQRVNAVTDVLKIDQEIPVKIIEIDRMGRINLSYVDALPNGGK
ncbi:MAG: polyribonucleotide nucleotidyltransferase [Spirochaetales bacterium]|jgi:polyribonucleotide nucleotidyltransferase|nr:polyribonucleotide nucleotidyltransferase [Spirochaetales bacterium]